MRTAPISARAPERQNAATLDHPITAMAELAPFVRIGTLRRQVRLLLLRDGIGADEILAAADLADAVAAAEGGRETDAGQQAASLARTLRDLAAQVVGPLA